MLLHDLGDLLGPSGDDLLEITSVLHTAEPLVLELREPVQIGDEDLREVAARLRRIPTVTVLRSDPMSAPPALVAAVDLCLTERAEPPRPWVQGELPLIDRAVGEHPMAVIALVSLLRRVDPRDVHGAIDAEATTYAMLLGSLDHGRWLRSRGPAEPRRTSKPPVIVRRDGDELQIVLDRPDARNAIDTALRDALVEALAIPHHDPDIARVTLRGTGPDFCAGGDLREFGTVDDPATAFAVRSTRHPGRSAHLIADRLTAWLHGHGVGAGIEVPAFAGTVIGDPGVRLGLPELALGLIPGAGGTVSIRRRIGRHRTTWLALTGELIDSRIALAWGLLDRIEPVDTAFSGRC